MLMLNVAVAVMAAVVTAVVLRTWEAIRALRVDVGVMSAKLEHTVRELRDAERKAEDKLSADISELLLWN